MAVLPVSKSADDAVNSEPLLKLNPLTFKVY